MAKRAALGRGLGALLAEANEIQNNREVAPVSEATLTSISEIPVSQIVPNPYQPRLSFDEDALNELADSIKTLGLIQPITLRQTSPNHFQIISGERRFRAAQRAGLTTIPAYIRKTDDAGMLEMAIVENIQRENLNPIDTALSFQRLIDECHLTQEGMASRVGKKRATVTNYLRLLKLPSEIQKALEVSAISVGHAKVLLSIEDESQQIALCENIIKNDWSVRQLEEKIKNLQNVSKKPTEELYLPDNYYKIADILGKYFNNNVSIKRNEKGAGVITVRFQSDEQMEQFLQTLNDKNL